MKKILSTLKRQDLMNQILLAAGFILCIVSIFMKQAKMGLVLVIVVCMLAVVRSGNNRKRLSRLYGALFFHMPDRGDLPHDLRTGAGGVYPRAAEQV